ncbi:MAG TPA: YebC/PmpR family DNA-binding transcriptional regulator [Alphaproteobacteria bacterium]|jgi:YebC/PmpR family DNA-binding regulatory protein|nr:YebC/PmpR family DNA-binding transcriptional regulator [Alphaproteobacteria bacterium]
MSGHSHFATIKRQKAANDAVKGNLFSRMARGIMLAAKGGADPDMNFKLRVEIDKARAASMPKENIERAIAKATSSEANLDEITYEGFGPLGLNVVIEAATNNKNRTAQELKNILEKFGGSMGGPGSVMFNFESKGFLFVKKTGNPEEQMLKLIDAGVEDVNETEDGIEVYVSPDKLGEIRKQLQDLGFDITETELQLKPKNTLAIETPEQEEKMIKFIDMLEENEDVQKVFTNLA